MKKADVIGMKFERLTILNDAKTKGRYRMVRVRCDCGVTKEIRLINITRGNTKSCGCYNQEMRKLKKGHNYTSFKGLDFIRGRDFGILKYTANRRNHEFNLDLEYLRNLFLAQDGRCALSDIPLQFRSSAHSSDKTASIDRIDSDKGYIKGNVQWVHKDLNKMKMEFNQEYFLQICQLVADNNRKYDLIVEDYSI